jgi:geranylgeranyl pyrophosphate synthase
MSPIADDRGDGQISPSPSLFVPTQKALRAVLYDLIGSIHAALRADILLALSAPGKLLYQQDAQLLDPSAPLRPAGLWALLVFYTSLCVNPQASLPQLYHVCVAIECFVCALDVLDDVEDDDQTEIIVTIGPARALNVSTALLALSQHILLSLDCDSALCHRLAFTMQQALLRATEGQQRDLCAEIQPMSDFTQEDCIDIAAQKAGALMSLACSIGVRYAGAEEDICERFAKIGNLLGIAAQLDNDSHDLYYLLHREDDPVSERQMKSCTRMRKTDLIREKKTLPLVLAFQQQKMTERSTILSLSEYARAQREEFSEAIYTAWGISLLYQARAAECLHVLEKNYTLSPELRALLRL